MLNHVISPFLMVQPSRLLVQSRCFFVKSYEFHSVWLRIQVFESSQRSLVCGSRDSRGFVTRMKFRAWQSECDHLEAEIIQVRPERWVLKSMVTCRSPFSVVNTYRDIQDEYMYIMDGMDMIKNMIKVDYVNIRCKLHGNLLHVYKICAWLCACVCIYIVETKAGRGVG